MTLSVDFGRGERYAMGTLSESGRDTVFRYDASFLSHGLNPAPFRLPVGSSPVVYDFSGRMETFGLFEDSLPDGWGRRIIDQRFRETKGRLPTVLERLACVGATGMGALVYEPVDACEACAGDFDFVNLARQAMNFDAGLSRRVLPELRRAAGSSGGARPKAFIAYNPKTGAVRPEEPVLPRGFEHWIVKFNTRGEGDCAGAEEFRYYQLALQAGAEMSPSCLLQTAAGAFFATKRFDRTDEGERVHMASAAGLLHADFRVPGDEYAILFKLADALTHDYKTKVELFRRATLNVLGHNRDDHLKNFSFLMDAEGRWRLAPFYDFTRAEGPNGWQTLSVSLESRRARMICDGWRKASGSRRVMPKRSSSVLRTVSTRRFSMGEARSAVVSHLSPYK